MNACCEKPANLVEQPRERPDVSIRVCRECGCRHIEMGVDPVEVGVKVVTL